MLWRRWNYLRMRGEYPQAQYRHACDSELPPRARRIRKVNGLRSGLKGTTSACAENTPCAAYEERNVRNYLRVRGEYYLKHPNGIRAGELPPRARRIRCRFALQDCRFGTTSACAENTKPRDERRIKNRNYLRVRGEYREIVQLTAKVGELPPRARRIHIVHGGKWGFGGTTSACAENTWGHYFLPAVLGNYLRVRGEYAALLQSGQVAAELPPRARRIRGVTSMPSRIPRTTSACAENTFLPAPHLFPWRNYLRVRGEYSPVSISSIFKWELPPRARRIHAWAEVSAHSIGTTSACAENTTF